jgi:hypothetical protein
MSKTLEHRLSLVFFLLAGIALVAGFVLLTGIALAVGLPPLSSRNAIAESFVTATRAAQSPTFTPTTEPSATPTETPPPLPTDPPTATPTDPPTATPTLLPTDTPAPKPTSKPLVLQAQPLAVNPPVAACRPLAAQGYGRLGILSAKTDRPAGNHPDLNLALRGWEPVDSALTPLDIWGPTDPLAPQVSGFFSPRRLPVISGVYQVYNWDFQTGLRTNLITKPGVTLMGLAATPGETIRVPDTGYEIGEGYNVMVLYADANSIALKYTREDNVANGYTVHVEDFCVDPALLSLYQALNKAGRGQLPALHNGQAFGSASGKRILVGIQDAGAWMDPRSRKDWWRP